MTTSLVLTCPIHGPDIESFTLAGTRFCSLCFHDFLTKSNLVCELSMKEVEVESHLKASGPPSSPLTCTRCSHTWDGSLGVSCPKCGTDPTREELSGGR